MLAAIPANEPVLFLLSGGASALVEVLPSGISLSDLRRVNGWLLASGLPIESVNAVRCALSTIKRGRLAAHCSENATTALLLSDVPGDDAAIIGSEPLLQSGLRLHLPALPGWLQDLVDCAIAAQPDSAPVIDIAHHIVADARMAR